ncbi:MAG: saccharopine dehydrogenase NADP-binding domain-containing protein [Candidatus Melainabacteria bacterium]|nr:saccharopine dehydrogenase NADP-binding domain-containing protein [Candidatus Melainabacteria bacterium]
MKIVVLGGAGAMGQVIVKDLCESATANGVVIADFNETKASELKAKLNSPKLYTAFADIRNASQLAQVLQGATVVVNSTPYYFNMNVMEAALAARCHYVDLGGLFHITRRQLELHQKFLEKNLLAVIGMGAAPGMTNIMAAHAVADLEQVESIDIIDGCVDFTKTEHPFFPPYALDTILDEYTKEPMVFENGEFAAKPPMSGEILVDFPHPVGRTKAIFTLHSEVATLPVSFKDKGITNVTFRLGLPTDFHERLKFLVELGFGSSEPVSLAEGPAVPRKVLAKLLERFPTPNEDPDDCEVIRVDVKGTKNRKKSLVRMETTVYSHPHWKVSCGALDTGVPPSIVAQMVGQGLISDKGVLPPEVCVPPEPFFHELAIRTITVRKITENVLA